MNLDTLITDLQAAHAGYAVEAERERLGLELETAFSEYEAALNAPHFCHSFFLNGSWEECRCRYALNLNRALNRYRVAAYQAEQTGVRLFSPERLESELAHTA